MTIKTKSQSTVELFLLKTDKFEAKVQQLLPWTSLTDQLVQPYCEEHTNMFKKITNVIKQELFCSLETGTI